MKTNASDLTRIKSENTIRGATFKILLLFWDRETIPAPEKWKLIREGLIKIQKDTTVVELGINRLCGESHSRLPEATSPGSNSAHVVARTNPQGTLPNIVSAGPTFSFATSRHLSQEQPVRMETKSTKNYVVSPDLRLKKTG